MTKRIHAQAYKVQFEWWFSGVNWYCNRIKRKGDYWYTHDNHHKSHVSGCGETPDEAFLDFLSSNNLKIHQGMLRPND